MGVCLEPVWPAEPTPGRRGPSRQRHPELPTLPVEVWGQGGAAPRSGGVTPSGREAMGCTDVLSHVLPTPLWVMGGVRGTPALLLACAHSPSTSAPCPAHTFPGNSASHTGLPFSCYHGNPG